MKRAYTHHGKQVLMNGFHFADCITEEAARRIAEALQAETPPSVNGLLDRAVAILRGTAGRKLYRDEQRKLGDPPSLGGL